jgi:hypothetical protein
MSKIQKLADNQLEKLINSMKNVDIQDITEDKQKLMITFAKQNKIFQYLLNEFRHILEDYLCIYDNIYLYEMDIIEHVYNIDLDDKDIIYGVNSFIKFLNRNIPANFRIEDVIYCIDNY